MPDLKLVGFRTSLLALAMLSLVSCGDRKAMLERLKTAQDESAKVRAELSGVEKQLSENRRQSAEMESLFFSQLAEPDAPPEKGRPKVPKMEDAKDALRVRVSQLTQQRESLEQQLKAAQSEMTGYRARLSQKN